MTKSGIGYVEGSFAGSFDRSELETFEKWLKKNQSDRIRFDASYVEHISRFHGGVPIRRFFRTQSGTGHVVERFLNFLPHSSESELAMYSVAGTWGTIEDRLGKYLLPFAELFGGDKLCFDYASGDRPRIVVWFHEQWELGNPHTETVAADFDEFLGLLSEEHT